MHGCFCGDHPSSGQTFLLGGGVIIDVRKVSDETERNETEGRIRYFDHRTLNISLERQPSLHG